MLIDKPSKMTSHDVVFKIKKNLQNKYPEQKIKVGHAGTLDPLANGLLVVLIGTETKNSDKYMAGDKEYVFNVLFGIKTKTGDIDPLEIKNKKLKIKNKIHKSKLKEIIESLKGKVELKVPAYSAIKVKGKKLYNLARSGKIKESDIPTRVFEIYSIKLLDLYENTAKIKINCSKGTYIRSIGEEIGKRMGIDSCIFNLRRTKSGTFNIKNAIKLEEFIW